MYKRAPDVYRSTFKGASQPAPTTSSYDPQIGAAAEKEAALGQQELNWSQNYYDQYVTPALKQEMDIAGRSETSQEALNQAEMAAMKDNQSNQDQVTAADLAAQKLSMDRYQQYGIPAENNYYDMVNTYSAPQYQEQQAEAAIGDQRAAAGTQAATMRRSMGAMGINGSSPAAVSAMSDMAVQSAAAEAAAATRARVAAQNLGIQLKSDAANFGRGEASQALSFGQGASSASSGGANGSAATGSVAGSAAGSAAAIGAQRVASTTGAASVPMAGYAGMQGALGNTLNAWTTLGGASIGQNGANERAYMEEQQKESAGIGGFLGTAFQLGSKAFGLPL